MPVLLSVDGLQKAFVMHQFNGRRIVGCEHIHFVLREGEFLGITGQSGAGKSTILKSIYRTYLPSGGRILYHSNQFGRIDLALAKEREIIAIRKKEIGYVSQFLNVMPRVTALEFVMETLLEMGETADAARGKAGEILSRFHIPEELWDTFPRTFSGGEKLRLNLARAMVKKPRLLLLDEPTASLDDGSKETVRERIIELKQGGTSMIGIFHDLDFMETVVDQEYRLTPGNMREGVPER